MEAGIDDVGCGVLYGLNNYKYDFVGMLMHAHHLEKTYGCGPHTISVPRIRPADDIDPETFDNGVPDDVFKRIVAVLRIAVPYTGMIMSTRESEKTRRECLEIGITQISGGSRTSVGGYAEEERQEDTALFDVEDRRTLAEVVDWLIELGYVPSFCTACYREGRTGDRFMHLLKTGQIANCCQPNALMTLKEFLMDYASEETQAKGDEIIAKRLAMIPNEKVREIATERLGLIEKGTRDFRF
jgi:2-iminoacetate synthase